MKPLAYDFCCGRGGWTKGLLAAGWDVIGFDIVRFDCYTAPLILADLRKVKLLRDSRLRLIVASPPCEEFSRHSMPWTRAKNPPPPDKSIWLACEAHAKNIGVPYILENVRGAQKFMGKSTASFGPFHLWGNVPPLLPPPVNLKPKESFGSKQRSERAEIPFTLAKAIGEIFLWRLKS